MTEQTIPEVSIEVMAYEAPPKDEGGNLIKGEDGKTIKGEESGKDKTFAYSLNQAGLQAAVKRFTVKSIVTYINRQLKTDCRNTIAADAKNAKDPDKKIKRSIAKVSKGITDEKRAELNTKLAEILAQYEPPAERI